KQFLHPVGGQCETDDQPCDQQCNVHRRPPWLFGNLLDPHQFGSLFAPERAHTSFSFCPPGVELWNARPVGVAAPRREGRPEARGCLIHRLQRQRHAAVPATAGSTSRSPGPGGSFRDARRPRRHARGARASRLGRPAPPAATPPRSTPSHLRVASTSIVTSTSSPTITPPPSSAWLHVIPKSRRSSFAVAWAPARTLPTGSFTGAVGPSTSSVTSRVTPWSARSPVTR